MSMSLFRRYAGVILGSLLLLLFSASAAAWTYNDLSPKQKQRYDQQQNFINYIYRQAGMTPPRIPYSVYLGPDTRGDNPDITDVTVSNRADSPARYQVLTYGQVFKKGDYLPHKELFYSSPDNPSNQGVQADIKSYYDDGSIKHAILSFQIDSVAPHGSEKLKLFTQGDTSEASHTISMSQLLASGFTAHVEINRNGETLTQDARTLLQAVIDRGGCDAVADTLCKTWLSGPLTSEWIVGGRLTDASTDRDKQLAVYFHIRAHADYSGQIVDARVNTVIENDFTYGPTAGNLTYDANISVGEQSYSVHNLTHYNHARWHKVLWWGQGTSDLYVRPDMTYLQATRAIPHYADLTPDASYLASLPSRYAPMTNGDQTTHMGDVGAHPGIGPLPRWSALFAISGDRHAFDYMLANDDAVGSYGFHFRDAETGRPVKITDHPYITIAARRDISWSSDVRRDLYTGCTGNCSTPYSFELAHHPSIGFLPYLVTGDYYYLEELQFAASDVELWANPGYRGGAYGRLRGAAQQVRQQAWSLRTLAQAAYATPDKDPMHGYFTTLLDHIATDYDGYYLQHKAEHPLHILDDYTNYPVQGAEDTGIAPWQEDFFAWAVSYASQLGFSQFDPFAKWLLEFEVGRMTNWIDAPDSGFCWIQAATYELKVKPERGAPFFSSLDDAYKATLPSLNGLACDSQEYRNYISEVNREGEMTGYPDSPAGFPSNLQPALAASVDEGVAKSTKAWDLFAHRSVQPRYNNYPNWAIVPRH